VKLVSQVQVNYKVFGLVDAVAVVFVILGVNP